MARLPYCEFDGMEGCIEGPVDVGPYLLRVIWVLAALSGLFLGLRLYSKLWRHRPLWWDDYCLVAAWVRPGYILNGFCQCS
jgi:hypothetical protein